MQDQATANTAPCEIRADVAGNLIRIAYVGHVSEAGMKMCVDAFKALLSGMRSGFTVLADLTRMESMELDCVTGLAKIMDACRDHGVGTVVRIVPDPSKDIGLKILGIVHYRGAVRVITCNSPAEAERVLAA
jgi:hypothetical protein